MTFNFLENFKKIFAGDIAQSNEESKEFCPHCRVSEDSLKILREKGEEKNRKEEK